MINLPPSQQHDIRRIFRRRGSDAIGLERQGWKIAFANDICQDKDEMYAAHFEEAGRPSSLKTFTNLTPTKIPR